jgi:1,4-alpha-glucan branching enzyme
MNAQAAKAGSMGRSSSLSDATINAVVYAKHGDPFAVLGPHQVEDGLWEVRAMLPGARSARVLSRHEDRVLGEMERLHPDGFFLARFASEHRPHYRLRAESDEGVWISIDPYSFGPTLTDEDLATIRDGGDGRLPQILGAHPETIDDAPGFRFAVWAPSAARVSVVGDFNYWDGRRHPMRLRHRTGVWELFIPGLSTGENYKFEIQRPDGEVLPLKADPLAFAAQHPPQTASVLRGLPPIEWNDDDWIAGRDKGDKRKLPMSIYECHLGSWARVPEDGNRYLSYRELAERLIPYVKDLGFTHIEMLPITEYPFDGSWGYQPVSLFAPTSRFGTPEDFAFFVEAAHAAGIGLILDWVPGHFPNDPHGLAAFDGSHLYEHADPRQGFHQDWGTHIYNYGREEVAAFLVANARFWLEHYHLDGLRVDAVASMLYLDYSRKAGEWIPNRHGGNENLDAISFMQRANAVAYGSSPGIVTIAEESTAWPGVSQPTYAGGLGFGFKWNMGWMHDTLHYMQEDPINRRYHHHHLTFGLLYAYSENYVLPLSHDEVVHGKGSLITRMPGDRWQKFANLRAYFGFMWAHPGKKLLFMGGEFGQEREWNHDTSLDWHLTEDPLHGGVQRLVSDLNRVYAGTPALHERDCEPSGFEWLVSDDAENSVLGWMRRGDEEDRIVVLASNFTPVPRMGYRLGVPLPGHYDEIINTDAGIYGGGDVGNPGGVTAEEIPAHGRPYSVLLTLPPLATIYLKLR